MISSVVLKIEYGLITCRKYDNLIMVKEILFTT